MIYKRILLSKYYPILNDSDATLEAYVYEPNHEYGMDFERPGMVIAPGGGYTFVSWREKEPIAFKYLSEGFNSFVVTYSTYKKYPQPQLEFACAIDYINKHRKKFHLMKKNLSIVGFSAGGHLVGSYGLYYEELANMINANPKKLKPLCIVMAYPVVSLEYKTHGTTRDVITNQEPELIDKLTIHKHVTKDFPPVYLWTTKPDTCVPYENTVLMDEALKANNILHETVVYDFLDHGLSLANHSVMFDKCKCSNEQNIIQNWVHNSTEFIYNKILRYK